VSFKQLKTHSCCSKESSLEGLRL